MYPEWGSVLSYCSIRPFGRWPQSSEPALPAHSPHPSLPQQALQDALALSALPTRSRSFASCQDTQGALSHVALESVHQRLRNFLLAPFGCSLLPQHICVPRTAEPVTDRAFGLMERSHCPGQGPCSSTVWEPMQTLSAGKTWQKDWGKRNGGEERWHWWQWMLPLPDLVQDPLLGLLQMWELRYQSLFKNYF